MKFIIESPNIKTINSLSKISLSPNINNRTFDDRSILREFRDKILIDGHYIVDGIVEKKFRNQETKFFNYKDHKYKFKMFDTGSIQLPGCKSIDSCYKIFNKFVKIINKKKIILDGETKSIKIKLGEIKIVMIHARFNILNIKLNMHKLYETLKNDNKITVEYTDKYPAVKIIVNGVRMQIFSSGNVGMLGSKTQEQVDAGHKYIVDFINENFDKICV